MAGRISYTCTEQGDKGYQEGRLPVESGTEMLKVEEFHGYTIFFQRSLNFSYETLQVKVKKYTHKLLYGEMKVEEIKIKEK